MTDRLVGDQIILSGLVKMNHQGPLFAGIDLNLKHFCLFFKSTGPVLIQKVDKGKTIDHDYYIGNCLIPIIKEIRQKEKSSLTNYKLFHNNGSPYTHRNVVNYLIEEDSEIISRLPYSPDLAPPDLVK